MKSIENKETSIPKSDTANATYADLFVIQLNKPLSKLVTVKEMRRDIRLLDIFEAAEAVVEVTDEDMKYLNELIQDAQWALKHKDIITFTDYIESLAA